MTKHWAEHWHRVGPRLDEVRRMELRNFNYEEQRPAIDALLQMSFEKGEARNASGLVELQRLLAKAKR